MNRILLLLVGLILFALLSFFCVQHHLSEIETDLTNRTQSALQFEGLEWANVAFAGRELTLTGSASSKELRQRVQQLASKVQGVASVDNQIKVIEAKPVKVTPAKDYSTEFTVSDGKLTLKGSVSDEETRESLLALAQLHYRAENIYDQLSVEAGAPKGWSKAAKSALTQLQVFENAHVQIVNTKVHLQGTSSNQTAITHLQSDINKNLPDAFQASFDIQVVKPMTKQPKSNHQPLALDCVKRFTQLFTGHTVRFKPDSHKINAKEHGFLNKLVDIALDCPGYKIEIGAYTDSRGSIGYNNRLSQRRADAVVKYLLTQGVAEQGLVAVGYGEISPIATNINQQGRAKNRRIEFKVVEN